MQVPEHPVAIKSPSVDGVPSTCREPTSGKRKSLGELELALAEANREAAQIAPQSECPTLHSAKVIPRRQLAEFSIDTTRSIRSNLAKSFVRTLANLS